MKENQGRIKAKDEPLRIEEGDSGTRRTRVRVGERFFKTWHAVYVATLAATVAVSAVMLAFCAESVTVRGDEGFWTRTADKIGDFFVSMDFLVFNGATHAPGEDSDFVYTPPSSDVNDDGSKDSETTDGKPSTDVSTSVGGIYDYDYSKVPEGCIPIIPMDLSLSSYGSEYINNSTGYSPDIATLIEKKLKEDDSYELLAATTAPQVLIIHTHGTEAYSEDGALYCENDGDFARSTDTGENVVAVGRTLAKILNENGIATLHCTVMHDSLQYKDSYARAEETINRYMQEYPTIKLVIDVHRDSIIKSSGEIVRPITELDGEAAAQLMCVVGSDWAGDTHPDWQNNLSLALKLREKLNVECENICRPVYLKPNTYNQEISPYSLLIEVGAEGNSLAEAQRSAELLAEVLDEYR